MPLPPGTRRYAGFEDELGLDISESDEGTYDLGGGGDDWTYSYSYQDVFKYVPRRLEVSHRVG